MSGDVELLQKPFDELTLRELHDLLKLRVDTFVVEQACAYPEVDERDPESTHLLAKRGDRLVGYCRWYPKGESVVLGRIVVAPEERGHELGRRIVEEALARIGDRPVEIWAQARLEGYYRKLGFRTTGQPFDDWGVLHVEMRR